MSITWNAEIWAKKFQEENEDYHELRREVWGNTRAIVEDSGYILPDGNFVPIESEERFSKFYYKPFTASFERLNIPPEITVTDEDCLDAAHKWVKEGLEVSVLNMASRQNPGGGVQNGSGAQEEYLFRCSDYYKFLYCYVAYAEHYGLTRSHYQYPLDRNFGGIFSEGVTIFRENEASGYRLAPAAWKVNMIAVAGMNSPRTIFKDGEKKIAPELVEGVKNKIRTIFRIACDNGQRNLILGALGCGALKNPPKHVAELFREILCEQEFIGAFKRICFAVKRSHTSKGDTNFFAFKETLDGFITPIRSNFQRNVFDNSIKKIVVARDSYALLKANGEVTEFEIHSGKSRPLRNFCEIVDIAAGFDHFIGLKKNGLVVFDGECSQASHARRTFWKDGISVAACEAHSAMLNSDGTVVCAEDGAFEVTHYKKDVETWQNIKQIALTFDEPYGLTYDGKFFCRRPNVNDFFNDCGKEIVQIAAFGCYYSQMTVAALYFDGTVKAWYGFCYNYDEIKEVKMWQDVKKICCGGHGAVIGLTWDGRIFSVPPPHETKDGTKATALKNIKDIAANFEHLVVLSNTGEIIYLEDKN